MTLNKPSLRLNDKAAILLGFIGAYTYTRGYILTSPSQALDALFLSAGAVWTLYTAYRIVRGIFDPAWLEADTPAHESSEPRDMEDTDDDD